MSRFSTIRGSLRVGWPLFALLPFAAPVQAQTFNLAVVPNLDSANVSILDTSANVEVARIPTGPRPFYVAMSPDGQFAYVGEDGLGTPHMAVDRINLNTLVVEAQLTFNESSSMAELEISPDGRWLAVSEIQQGTTYIVDTQNWTVAHTVVLCPICDGETEALFSPPNFSFSADSRTLYAGTNVNDLLTAVDLATGAVVETRPAQNSFGSPYSDIETGADGKVFLAHPDSSGTVRRFDMAGSGSSDLSLSQTDISDFALIPRPGTTLLAAGSIVYDSNADYLSVLDLSTRKPKKIPSSESLRYLRYNPVRNELWATCVGAFGFCAPFVIDVFDLNTLTRRATIPGVSGASVVSRHPALSANFQFYYQPLGSLDKILVIDAATLAIVKQIPVGTNPRAVYIQGDTAPHEK